MGKLAFYGAIGGLGKGLEQQYLLDNAASEAEKKDSRSYQLNRMLEQGRITRQRESDAANTQQVNAQIKGRAANTESVISGQVTAAEKLSETNKATATAGVTAASNTAAALAETEQAEALALSESASARDQAKITSAEKIALMRENATNARDRLKIEELDKPYIFNTTKEQKYWDNAKGAEVIVPSQSTVTDLTTNVTYLQHGTNFVPQGNPMPDDTLMAAGKKAESWLLGAKGWREAENRHFIFLSAYGYIPAQYFHKYGAQNRRTGKILTRSRDASTAQATYPPEEPQQLTISDEQERI